MEQLGLIGLGIMGKPMAHNLLKAGCPVLVNDTVPQAVEAVKAMGGVPASQEEMGRQCDVVFLSLPSGQICEQVVQGLAATMRPGALVVDTSSITPTQAKVCASMLEQKGVGYLDAPVSGGEPGAVNGTLAFMVGGSQRDFDRAKPYFEILGSSAERIGPVGSGSVTKLANQIIVNNTIAVVSEALVFATKAGADPEKVYRAIRGGLAGSAVLDAKAPMMYNRNFTPGGRISINHKDIKNVLETAHAIDAPVPLSAQLFEILQTLKVGGHMNDDHSGIVQYFEQLAGVIVKKGE